MADRLLFVALAAIISRNPADCFALPTSNTVVTNQLLSPFQQQTQVATLLPSQLVSSSQPQLIPESPVYATTIVDNSVSNALANALQLLIVSDLIESTLNARNVDVVTPCGVVETEVLNAYVPEVVEGYGSGYPVVQEVVQSYVPQTLAEVVFPSAIPAQLICNFGYVPSAQPAVQVVGIEPLASFPTCSCGSPSYYY